MSQNLTLGGPQAGYKYEFKTDGVYLTIYPAVEGERLFELSDMRQILRECKVLDYDVGNGVFILIIQTRNNQNLQ